jgi:hypothetical protein
MSIPLPILEKKLKDARRLYPAVEHSMRLRGGLLQNALAKNLVPKAADQDYTFQHKGTQWRCRVRATPNTVHTHALLWWLHGPKDYRNEALDAILLRGHDMPLHFDTHFFGRWGLRSPLMGVHLTNMMGFFKRYPVPPVRPVKKFYDAQPDYAGAIEEGLIFGRRNGNRLVSCDTFKEIPMFSADERKLWEKLMRKTGA